MNDIAFNAAIDRVIDRTRAGIGTLSEKTTHAVLKYYLEPDANFHERKIAGFVADMAGEDGIFEIQTKGFYNLRRKLDTFLEIDRVTVVYPVIFTKWLVWVNPETGETTKRRKSPKIGNFYSVFPELYQIKNYLLRSNLHFLFIGISAEEHRYLNGWSKNKKRGSSRCDTIPLAVEAELAIVEPDDYRQLVPDTLPEIFSSYDYQRRAKISRSSAQTALNVLSSVGTIKQVGKGSHGIILYSLSH